jgi:hypothetical protein
MEELTQCICGCGKMIPVMDTRGRPHKFSHGHGRRKTIEQKTTTCSDCGVICTTRRAGRCNNCHEKFRWVNKEWPYYKKFKEQYFSLYGAECVCCGERELEFLSIDHINGGGNEHRKSVGTIGVFAHAVKVGPDAGIYRTLCFNCNFARGHSKNGRCPHEYAHGPLEGWKEYLKNAYAKHGKVYTQV